MSTHFGYKIFSGGVLVIIAMSSSTISNNFIRHSFIIQDKLKEITKELKETNTLLSKSIPPQAPKNQKPLGQKQETTYSLASWCPWPGVASRSSRPSKQLK
jgi:hypothetical protein